MSLSLFPQSHSQRKEYSQQFKFRISMGNISEIWQLTMKRGAIINSPAHMSGTHEHIMVNSGSLTLMLRLHNDQNIVLEAGDFYAFSGDFPHSYLCMEGELQATVVMTYSILVIAFKLRHVVHHN